DMVLPMLCRG
ncbi:Hypothetical protein EIN_211090, partial [Entamoeba invadens IP1]